MPEVASTSTASTLVLVHGAGHTSLVWRSVQDHLRHRSVAVDLPGRRDRPGDLTAVTIGAAVESVAADVVGAVDGRVVLVGHSAGGIILPALTARLGERVEHLVFVAGLSAPHGDVPVETFLPGEGDRVQARLDEMRDRYAGRRLRADGDGPHETAALDAKLATNIDSLNYITQTVFWDGVPPDLPRTFVRCLRDPIQSREVQARLAANCGASTIIDLDTGHTPALEAPLELADVLDRIAGDVDGPAITLPTHH